jgi:hypothetical protein
VEGLDHDDHDDDQAGGHGPASGPANADTEGLPLLQIQRRPPGPCPVPEEIS